MSEFLMNCWYQAGWSHEIEGKILSRVLLGERRMFWRRKDGSIAGLQDRCPHRMAPLSMGVLKDDTVTCIYHGLTFDGQGRCMHGLFSAEVISPNVRVRTYPVVERDSIIWFWPGDPGAADESKIPDFSFLRETPGFKPHFGYAYVNANYLLINDNLMDTTHIELVHRGTFGARGVIQKGRMNVFREGELVHANFWVEGLTAEQVWPEPVPPADAYNRWIDMRWNAPSFIRVNIGTVPEDTVPEEGLHDKSPGMFQAHGLTPETESTTHYFWAVQDQLVGDRTEETALGPILEMAFGNEDKPVLEAVQGNMKGTDLWAEKPIFLKSDEGGLTSRRVLEALIRKERSRTAEKQSDPVHDIA